MISSRLASDMKHKALLYILASIFWIKAMSNSLDYGMSIYVINSDHKIGNFERAPKRTLQAYSISTVADFLVLTQTSNLRVTCYTSEKVIHHYAIYLANISTISH